MTLAELIADAESRLERHRVEVTAAIARLRATEAELETLKSSASSGRIRLGTTRTEAIIAVLRKSQGPMETRAITAALNEAGLESSSKDVASTLHHLLLKGRILRHARGSYRLP